MDKDIDIREGRLEKQMEKGNFVLAVVTATKPDFYKQAPLINSAENHDVPCFGLHTGQHYDELLGHGLKEYNIQERMAADLKIRGGLSKKTSELMLKVKKFAKKLERDYGDKTVLPIVHGDTHAAGIFPQAWMFATNQKSAHNEAGLRGMQPDYSNHVKPEEFIESQFKRENWTKDRSEPFPEQYNTFVGSAASQYHFAPTKINQEHLISEGYPKGSGKRENIKVVGNSVVDAIEMKEEEETEESVFDVYPVLEEKDDWIRVDIHRRANLLPGRFDSIIQGVIDLVEAGYNVNFVEMNATREALENYNLREKIKKLDEYDNFLYTELWKKHAHVYEFLKSGQCFAELTDSGSMQEELNHIDEAICLTCRFNTDRPETVFRSGTNLLVPPISGEYIFEMVERIYENDDLRDRIRTGEKIYGDNVSDKIIKFLERQQNRSTFEWSHNRAGFSDKDRRSFNYL